MELRRSIGTAVCAGLLVAACGGNAATQAPGGGGGGGGGGGATQQPAATQNGGGGGGGGGGSADFTYGKVTFTISGPVTDSGAYGFVPAASAFGGDQGSSLSFTDNLASGTDLISIIQGQDGAVVVSYVSAKGQVPAATCTTSDWNMGAGQGSGKFDCKSVFSITASGASVEGGEIKGEFTAHT